ncbi:MAG: hypothetical protein EVA89_33620 [Sandaracinaceae bacterium]|nr:MAG: hypothetical protein EVA89_33620 [Sandaracinaceae bacterium]
MHGMSRRRALGLALGSGTALLAFPGAALAQLARGPRPDWEPDGPLDGREPADDDAMTPEERRHVPVLTMPLRVHPDRPFDLVVQAGLEPHGMTEAHHIDWMEVALDDTRLAVADLGPSVAYPIIRVPIVLRRPGLLTARIHCTLHGTWRTRRAIQL